MFQITLEYFYIVNQLVILAYFCTGNYAKTNSWCIISLGMFTEKSYEHQTYVPIKQYTIKSDKFIEKCVDINKWKTRKSVFEKWVFLKVDSRTHYYDSDQNDSTYYWISYHVIIWLFFYKFIDFSNAVPTSEGIDVTRVDWRKTMWN